MHALVVYESLWGNTRAIAEAIAEGIGSGATALPTDEVAPSEASGLDLLVVGAPVHAFNLPTRSSKDSVAARPVPPGALAPELSQPPVREWMASIASGTGNAAAFDTRIKGPLGRGGAKRIEKMLADKGYRIIAPSQGFLIVNQKAPTAPATMLRPGEIQRARLWGAELAASLTG